MRSPLGYCKVHRCRRWVREDKFPRRCPAHKDVPSTMSEMLAEDLRRVYLNTSYSYPFFFSSK